METSAQGKNVMLFHLQRMPVLPLWFEFRVDLSLGVIADIANVDIASEIEFLGAELSHIDGLGGRK